MVDNTLDKYKSVIDEVLIENPVSTLEKYKAEISWISSANILQIHTKVAKQWEKYRKAYVQLSIAITAETQTGKVFTYNYNFNDDIRKIKQNAIAESYIYIINKEGHLLDKELSKEKWNLEHSCNLSSSMKSIVLHLGLGGVDLIVNGKVCTAQNCLKSYKDLLDSSKQLPIQEYKKLLEQYFAKNVQFDPCELLYARNIDIPKDKRVNTTCKYKKLLRAQPENLLHKGLTKFLRENCSDTVIREYTNAVDDRYDVFISSEKDQIYIIELKWLGRSITSEFNVFSNYNSPERAIAGAYQLQKYVDRAEEYNDYLMEYPIYCAILLVYDFREEYTDINYPEEILNYSNIDLSQIYKCEKEDINASEVYKQKKMGIKKGNNS